MYELGIDLGTTYTAAAIRRGDRVDVVTLGSRSPVIPSVIVLADDGSVLTGEGAQRRALTDPTRVAREFKRRIGDPLPVIVGGSPQSAESLTALLLRSVVDTVTKLEGSAPTRVALTHPANWGNYKKELYAQAVRFAELRDVVFLTEPEAAAIHYAAQERIDVGSVIAVYDLGGGTFDATVLRKTEHSFEILGHPEGIERLGGIDFDQAIFAFVCDNLSGAMEELDRNDPAALSAVARLRQECVEAKEALSVDTEASVAVALPGLHTEVRITRPELESMLRRPIADTVAALRRGLRDAQVEPDELTAVLLVGGSSRIPMVAEMVGSELGRPVAVDAHPKYAIATGAARFAGLEPLEHRRVVAATPAPAAAEVIAAAPVAVELVIVPEPEPVVALQPVPAMAPAPVAAVVAAVAPLAPAPVAKEMPTAPARSVAKVVPAPEPAPVAVAAATVVTPPPTTVAPPPQHTNGNGHGPGNGRSVATAAPAPAGPAPAPSELDRPTAPAMRTGGEPPTPKSSPFAKPAVKWGVIGVVAAAAIGGGVVAMSGGGGGGGGAAEQTTPAVTQAPAAAADGCPNEGPFLCITEARLSGATIVATFRQIDYNLGGDKTGRFFIEASPDAFVRWDTPDPFQASVGSLDAGARLCSQVNNPDGSAVAGSGNCVTITVG